MAAYARDQNLAVKSFYYWGKQVRALKANKKVDLAQTAHFHPVQITSPTVLASISSRSFVFSGRKK